MTFIPSGEKIIETKKCLLSGRDFVVTDKDLEFYDKISPIFGGKKYLIPAPTLCPDERQKRRLAFRNERKLYKRKCDKTEKEIVAVYKPQGPYKIYDQSAWWSDDWSPLDYGVDFDFNISFFAQIGALSERVPHPNLFTINNSNSPYAQYTGESKNIYMSADVWRCEDTFYSATIKEIKNSLDLYEVEFAELCSECTLSKNMYACHWAVRSFDCQNCDFIFNCTRCTNCLFCWGLKNKNYHIYNKPVSKEQYSQIKNKLFENQANANKALQDFSGIVSQGIIKANWNINCENCIGDDLKDCKDCFMSFDAVECENCRYCTLAYQNKNCMDTIKYNPSSEWTIEGVCGGVELHSCGYTYTSLYVSDGWYAWECVNSNNIFGCVGLHSHEHHCILNKSYSTAEYETLCGKIIDHMRSTGEWGEFFPHELTPFGYNETVDNEYFPMIEEEVKNMPRFEEWKKGNSIMPHCERGAGGIVIPHSSLSCQKMERLFSQSPGAMHHPLSQGGTVLTTGWNWHTEDTKPFTGMEYTPLPIRQYDERVVGFETAQKNIDAVLAGTIQCEVTKKPFKIIKQELLFYIENSIPIPTKHPDQRHQERMDLRNPRTLYKRACSECHKDIISTYSPERLEKIVCEECYRKLVY